MTPINNEITSLPVVSSRIPKALRNKNEKWNKSTVAMKMDNLPQYYCNNLQTDNFSCKLKLWTHKWSGPQYNLKEQSNYFINAAETKYSYRKVNNRNEECKQHLKK
jgi:hypothetical protein